jgi:hypothetical protein
VEVALVPVRALQVDAERLPISEPKLTSSFSETSCTSKKNGCEIDSCALSSVSSRALSPKGELTLHMRSSCLYAIASLQPTTP